MEKQVLVGTFSRIEKELPEEAGPGVRKAKMHEEKYWASAKTANGSRSASKRL